MKCTHLAERIERLRPDASARDVARLCLLLTNTSRDVSDFRDDRVLTAAWREMDLRLRTATDQHQAMTEDLEGLVCSSDHEEQTWRLIRAFKVQSQILQLYLGGSVSERGS